MERKLRLKPNLIGKADNGVTKYAITKMGLPASRNTIYGILGDNAPNLSWFDLDNFAAILIDGMGFTPEQVLDMKIGDLFTVE